MRTLAILLLAAISATPATAQEKPICLSDKQHGCWFDANAKAREKMLDGMESCSRTDDYPRCILALGWREPVLKDERFMSRMEFRK